MKIKKLLFTILGFLFLTSCVSSKAGCDAYNNDDFVVTEANIKIPSYHHHFDEAKKCVWSESYIYVYRDTMFKPKLEVNEIKEIKYFVTKNK